MREREKKGECERARERKRERMLSDAKCDTDIYIHTDICISTQPASTSGMLKAGDIILKVDTQKTDGMRSDQVVCVCVRERQRVIGPCTQYNLQKLNTI